MRYPFDKYKLGARFGVKGSLWKLSYHSGQNIMSANYGGDSIIYPFYNGIVQKITNSGSYDNCVYVRHSDGYITMYAYLKTVYVKAGQSVTEKTVLGAEGATGNATGKHLHLEVHKGEYHYLSNIDPLVFIKERGGR